MKTNVKLSGNRVPLFLLSLYIFFCYVAMGNALVPARVHSLVMYAFLGTTMVYLLIKKRFLFSSYTIFYGILITFSIVSFLYAEYLVISTLYTMVVYCILTFCVISIVRTKEDLMICIKAFVVGAVAMIILMWFKGYLNINNLSDRLGKDIAGNANGFSMFLMSSSVFTAWLLVYRSTKKNILFYLIALLAQISVMALSGGRKTFISVVACIIVFILFKRKKQEIPFLKNFFKTAIILLFIYLIIMNVPVFYNMIGKRFQGLFNFLQGGESSENGDKTRELMIQFGIEKWTERPFFGYGLDNFKYFNETVTGHFYYAHNNFVELLYDLGLIGCIIYYSFWVYLIFGFMTLPKNFWEYKILGLGLLLQVFIFDLGGASYFTGFTQIVLCFAFIILKLCREQEREENYLKSRIILKEKAKGE